jgi:hypothetical protein
MKQLKAEGMITLSAMIVTIVYAYRKLVEPSKVSAPTAHFVIGFGFLYVSLSMLALGVPELAGMFAILIAVADLLSNGQALVKDYQGTLTATAKATAPA